MIFLVNNFPKCFSENDFPPTLNLKGNRVYFIMHGFSSPIVTDAFRLEDGKWEQCPSLTFEHSPFLWYAPKIDY